MRFKNGFNLIKDIFEKIKRSESIKGSVCNCDQARTMGFNMDWSITYGQKCRSKMVKTTS